VHTSAISVLDVLRRSALQIYILLTYLLTNYISVLSRYTAIFIYLFIYLFIYYEWSYNTYIVQEVQEESTNKVITKITTTRNAKSSHTHHRMQTCYHQKN